ncbi:MULTISPECIES: TIGR02466 family protein [Streptomyces]|uniref:TIGR02466 family protein n=1 Tax=Streptomyces TaxID=1883 RepID=UPI00067A9A03|nr:MULTISPECIES: TIGR02466 family protein [Streptomyces]
MTSFATAEPGTWPARGACQQLWPTPVYRRTVRTGPDTDTLAQQILIREAADPSRTLGAPGARKSAPDVLSWPLPAVTVLKRLIREAARAVTGAGRESAWAATAWAVHYHHGGHHLLHAHHDSAVSGVYYLQAPADAGGALELFDPRPARLATGPRAACQPLTVQPHPGLLIAFPSWLRHAVAPHTAAAPRLCIAVNLSPEER